jgi:ferredoxin
MMAAVQAVLAGIGLPAEQVKTELFLAPERPATPPPTGPTVAPAAECTFRRSGKKAPLTPEKTVLEAAESVGVAIDYSCRQGFCGVCRTRLVSGQVTMAVEDGLSPEDKAAGYILACQAKSVSNVAVEA